MNDHFVSIGFLQNQLMHVFSVASMTRALHDKEARQLGGGRLSHSRNNVSVVKDLEEGLFSACCQNGLGKTRGTLSGLLSAELATQTWSDLLRRALNAETPKHLPPKLLTNLEATAYLEWLKHKAGCEL